MLRYSMKKTFDHGSTKVLLSLSTEPIAKSSCLTKDVKIMSDIRSHNAAYLICLTLYDHLRGRVKVAILP